MLVTDGFGVCTGAHFTWKAEVTSTPSFLSSSAPFDISVIVRCRKLVKFVAAVEVGCGSSSISMCVCVSVVFCVSSGIFAA
jgi:hypothetical protein